MSAPRPGVRTTIVLLAGLLAATGCAGSSTDAPAVGPSPRAAPPSAQVSASPPSSADAAPSPTRPTAQNIFEISFVNNQLTGDTGKLKVGLGETVSIRVTSSRPDQVHLHGYDVSAPVAPGQPALLSFTATIPGAYELELEDLGRQLASLQVS